jgi:hypothetical protein
METSFLFGMAILVGEKGFLGIRSEEKVYVFGKAGCWVGF